jgi:carbon-monoxide dehydrogenase large subunit
MTTQHTAEREVNRWAPARAEDRPILTGDASYLDDVVLAGMLHAAMVRSPVPHARILSIDTSSALALPGVHAILTGDDVAGLAPQPVIWQHIANQQPLDTRAIAQERVRYVGQVVAAVVADSRALAEDAADLVDVEYEPLDVVMDPESATAPEAIRLHADWESNEYGSARYGTGDTDAAFADADVIVQETLRVGRQFACPLEPRGCVATWNSAERALELWISAQSPNRVRELIAEVMGISLNRIRVRVPAIGGGFGCKADFYPEEVIVAMLSQRVRRSVKWIEDRRESFMATVHAREQVLEMELAANADGTIRAVRGRITGVLGGEVGSTGMGPAWLATMMLPGPYRIPALDVTVRGVATNKTPAGAYRGWGQPKGNFAMERLIDRLSVELKLAPNEVRRRNFWAAEEFPMSNGMGPVYDSGRYAECLALAETTVADLGWPARKEGRRQEGVAAGIGYAFFVESTAAGPSKALSALGLRQGGFDAEVVRMDSSGRITVYTGQTAMGQGIQTALATACAEAVGVPKDWVRVVFGDTETCPYTGYGTGGSRAGALGGAAVAMAGRDLRMQILRAAAEMLEVAEADLELAGGAVQVRGTDITLPVAQVAFAAYRDVGRLGAATPTLEARAVFDPPGQAYAFGCAVAFAEVDPDTGQAAVTDYILAHDCGRVLDLRVVEGQLAGGSAQGLAGALFEELVYDESGQLLTTTFLDYLLPTAMETPDFTLAHQVTPSPNIPGGMKGVGEAGVIPSYAVVAAAIDDALAETGCFLTQVPFTPERVFEAMRGRTAGYDQR